MIDILVRRLMDYQEKSEPDASPGDLSIEWQDDSQLVTVAQDGYTEIGFGQTAEEALLNFADQIGVRLHYG